MRIQKMNKKSQNYKIINDDGDVCFTDLNAAFAKSLVKIRKDYLKKMEKIK